MSANFLSSKIKNSCFIEISINFFIKSYEKSSIISTWVFKRQIWGPI